MQYKDSNNSDGRKNPNRQSANGGNASRSTPQPSQKPQSRQKNTENLWVRAIFMVIATIGFCVFLAFFILQTANDLFGLNQEDRAIEIIIPEKSSNTEIAKILKEAGVVENRAIFNFYSGLKTKERKFQSGTYMFNANLGYDQIIVALKSGDYEKKEVRVTVVEGKTLREIAQQLEDAEVCKAQEFIDYLNSAEYDYEFFNGIKDDPLRYFKLEGYIFPDTYDFYVGEKAQDVARKFVQNFNKKITPELQNKMLEMNMSIDDTIILASIIQREAAKDEDMKKVSSVFHNRMQLSQTYPNLQSDVTILYVENDIKPYIEKSNQEMYDAYNTYICKGIPVGAICNPGMNAIEAALNPAETKYYFFVTDKNEDFYYAETPKEHYTNVATAKAVGGIAHGVDTQ